MKEGISVRRQLLWGLLIVLIAGVAGTALWIRQGGRLRREMRPERPLEGLGVFGRVPEFSLTERSGRKMELSDLVGKVWIVNFIYTHCPDSCPIQSAQMKELQAEFQGEKNLRLVSITVDPRRDSAKVLYDYANRFQADPERWFFLTGERDAIYRLAQQGFLLGAAEIPREKREPSGATHAHSPRFVLVDGRAQIRGYYPATEGEAVARLRRDLRVILRGEK
ncbi:MAG: SCO family protein [Candidatus Binatota bacterium]